MTQKEQIIKIIEELIIKFENDKEYSIKRYFMTDKDKRWFEGIVFGLQELECLIYEKIKDENIQN